MHPVLFLLALVVSLGPCASRAAEAGQAIVDGPLLAAEARSVEPAGEFRYTGLMTLKRAGRVVRVLPVVCDLKRQGKAWRETYRLGTNAQAETLVVLQEPGQTNQYLLATNGQPQPWPLLPSQAERPLAESDFCVSDLGREYLFWPGQTVLRAEMRKSRACRVLQSTPAATNTYSRVLSWVDVDTSGVIMAESYGPSGDLVKEFEVRGLFHDREVWHPKELLVSHPRQNTRTLLEFDFKDWGAPEPGKTP